MCEFYELNSIKVSGRMWIFSARKVNFLLIYLRNFNQRKVFESLHWSLMSLSFVKRFKMNFHYFMLKVQPLIFFLAKNLNVFIVYCHKSYHGRILLEHAEHKLPIYILPVLTNFDAWCINTLSNTNNCHIYF